jgi:AbrB family looped-hinge helix DNA binding protein
MEKTDIVRMSSKGQIVIPQNLRQRLGIGAKSQLVVYQYADALIMKKLDVKDVEKRLQALYKRIDARNAKYGELTDRDIQQEIEKYRKQKRKQRA